MSPRSNENATFFENLHMYLVFCMVLGHLKSRKKVCQIDDTCVNLKKKLHFRVGGVNIDVTTLQRETYFLKDLFDVLIDLQNFLLVPCLGRFWMRGGVYINMV